MSSLIEQYAAAMVAGDSKALAAVFTDKCRYFDYCPVGSNRANYHVYGRAGVEMFFHNKFFFHSLVVTDPVIEDENTATFVVAYSGTYIFVKAVIESIDEDGLIHDLKVCQG